MLNRLILFGLFALVFTNPLWSQKGEQIEVRYDSIICYAADYVAETFVPPPKKFLSSSRVETATINVNYIDFTEEAKAAFQYAVDIWETLLISDVPINIEARFASMEETTLGSAIWGALKRDFGEGFGNTWYPMPLAEKMAGKEINVSTDPDIIATFNKNANWYYGLDGTPDAGYDLVTVVLHEIGHGLGITDSFGRTESGMGSWGPGNSNFPMAYDQRVLDGSGNQLLDFFENESEGLGSVLTSNSIFFRSSLASKYYSGNDIPLYAPNEWKASSSIAHLNESSFLNGNANSLMTPFIALKEAIHDPGPITLGMLADMGWNHLRIQHQAIINNENINNDIVIDLSIVSDAQYDPATVLLYYSRDENPTLTQVVMTELSPGNFSYTIPAPGQDASYKYYISVVDEFERTFSHPNTYPSQLNEFKIQSDIDPPTITHRPLNFIFAEETTIPFHAEITDFLGVESAFLEYKINDGASSDQQFILHGEKENHYDSPLDLLPLNLVPGDTLFYRISATDKTTFGNNGYFPEDEWQAIAVVDLLPPVNFYATDFEGDNSEWIGFRMNIEQPSGFSSAAIHTKHPYENGDDAEYESNFLMVLTQPILLNDSKPYLEYEEIVLIEPGEDNSYYGDLDFYDYVIVEGSKDGGKTWQNFENGYDSRLYPTMKDKYNSSIVEYDSESLGNESHYTLNRVFLLPNGKFQAGDEVILRFRLFADQLAHGWGWAIDNIEIQTEITSVDPIVKDIKIYPNPVSGNEIAVESEELKDQEVELMLFDAMGKNWDAITWKQAESQITIHLSHLPSGNYILVIQTQKATFRKKLIIID